MNSPDEFKCFRVLGLDPRRNFVIINRVTRSVGGGFGLTVRLHFKARLGGHFKV